MFKHPFTMCIAGCTGSGKSQWVQRFLHHLDPLVAGGPIAGVLYCYGEVNDHVLRLQRMASVFNNHNNNGPGSPRRVRVCHGAPEEGEVEREARATGGRLLLVLDDLLLSLRGTFLDTVFTRGSHNWGVSVVLITQHLFTPELRIARNNSHYLVLMRNPAGALQIRNLGTQLFPGAALRFFLEAYEDATAEPFGYLLIDMHPTTEVQLRLRTHIYPDDELCVVKTSRQRVGAKKVKKFASQPAKPLGSSRSAPPTAPVFSEHVKRNVRFFQQLKAAGRSQHRYRALVAGATSEQLLCLVECALNILRSRVPIQRRHLQHLRRQATNVRQLSKVRSRRAARQLLLRDPSSSSVTAATAAEADGVQSGRGLPPLVGLLASVLLPVLIQRAVGNSVDQPQP
uniref:AAA+ ATPase domain-containing protein n=1 Tax=Globodera rostochiensis TaxID=31243 RepID=A0A914HMP6_GLORO